MTSDEYWCGDPLLVRFFYEAHMEKLRMENANAWIHGLYVYDAISSAMSNAFGGHSKYRDKPYDLFPRKKTKEEELADLDKFLDAFTFSLANTKGVEKINGRYSGANTIDTD